MSKLIPRLQSISKYTYPVILNNVTKPIRVPFRGFQQQSSEGVNLSIYSNTETTVSPLWLRHHCRCSKCFHPSTHQRLVIPSYLKNNNRVKSVKLNNGVVAGGDGDSIEIIWDDDHISNYNIKWLQDNIHDGFSYTEAELSKEEPLIESERDETKVTVRYEEVMNDNNEGLAAFMRHILKSGYALVSGVPATVASTRKLVERISHPQTTLYGQIYEFESNLLHADTSYTNEYVHLHTDATYFTEPNALQVFHCLRHDGEGGINSVVDGFKVAEEFRQEYPLQYDILKSTPVPWQYVDPGKYSFYNIAPIFEHNLYTGKLQCLRYNPHDMAPLNTIQMDKVPGFYESVILLSDKIENSAIWFKLNPGTVLFTDNWRVLHGRSEFTGYRKMCGCYISRSDWLSKCKVLL